MGGWRDDVTALWDHTLLPSTGQLKSRLINPSQSPIGHAYYIQKVIKEFSISSYEITRFFQWSEPETHSADNWLILIDIWSIPVLRQFVFSFSFPALGIDNDFASLSQGLPIPNLFQIQDHLDLSVCVSHSDMSDSLQPGSSVHGIFQTRIVEWVAISFSKRCSWPRDQTSVSCTATREAHLDLYHSLKALKFKVVCKTVGT